MTRRRRADHLLARTGWALRANWTLKLLAVVFAVILWRFVVGEREAEIGFIVPIELRNIPSGMVVAGDVEREAQVRLVGPQTLLAGLSSEQVRVSIDVSQAHPDRPRTVRLSRAVVSVPTGVDLVRVSPPEVVVRVEPVARRRVPVEAAFTGAPEAGAELKSWQVDPPEVDVVGGAQQIARIAAVETAPIDLTGVSRDLVRDVPLATPPDGIRIDGPPAARVQVRIGRTGS